MKVNFRNVIRKMPWHANMTEMNHLGRALLAKPAELEGTFRKIFAAYDYSNAPMFHMLSSEGREMKINGTEWTWKLSGSHERPLVSLGNINTGEKFGIRNTSFKIKLDENWRLPGDVLTPGDAGKKFSVRVVNNPIEQGNGWVYTVVMADGDPDNHLPAKYLAAGTEWTKMFSSYGEGATDSGSTTYALPFELRSRLGRFRKQYKVTGDAAQEVLAVPVPDKDGNLHKMWIKYAEAVYWKQWYQELEAALWYNRDNGYRVKDSTGRPVMQGPGLQQLLEDGNQETYNVLSGKLIQEFLTDIFFGRVRPDSGYRRMVAYTGEQGMLDFHNAVQRDLSKSGFIQVVDNKFVKDASSPYNSNALQYGYQFTKYIMANGVELEMRHCPIYDMAQYNRDIDPLTGRPKESKRITFMDLNTADGTSNLQLVKRENAFKHVYVAGTQTPYGVANNALGSHSGDFYEVHIQDDCGVHLHDASGTGELIYK